MSDIPTSRLLSGRSGLSISEKERILARIREQQRRPKRWVFFGSFAAACATAAILLLLHEPTIDGELTPRGKAEPALTLRCAPECKVGSKLLFRVDGSEALPFVALFATTSEGRAVWFVPSNEKERSLAIGSEAEWLDQAAALDEGTTLDVRAVYSNKPLSRAEIRSLFEAGEPAPSSERSIVRRQIEVAP